MPDDRSRDVCRSIGVYEKALPDEGSWKERFTVAAQAGFEYVELSIDESDERLQRLDWSSPKLNQIREAMDDTGVSLRTLCLSAHRRFPLGSHSEETREQGERIFKKAIKLACRLGIRVVQVMGYDVFYESRDEETEEAFFRGMNKGIEFAADQSVMLGLENVDTPFVNSLDKALSVIERFRSPWFQLYSDVGNLVGAEFDPLNQLPKAREHLLALHIKDARPGEIRRVPFGNGDVPFDEVFSLLEEIGYRGPYTVEMWVDHNEDPSPKQTLREAHTFVEQKIKASRRNESIP